MPIFAVGDFHLRIFLGSLFPHLPRPPPPSLRPHFYPSHRRSRGTQLRPPLPRSSPQPPMSPLRSRSPPPYLPHQPLKVFTSLVWEAAATSSLSNRSSTTLKHRNDPFLTKSGFQPNGSSGEVSTEFFFWSVQMYWLGRHTAA